MNVFPIHRAVTDCPDHQDTCRHACTVVCKRMVPEAIQARVVKLGITVHTFYDLGVWSAYDDNTYEAGGHLGLGATERQAVEELLDSWESTRG